MKLVTTSRNPNGNNHFVVMRKEGLSLDEVAKKGQLTVEMAYDAGSALADLFKLGIIHGDLDRAEHVRVTGEKITFIDFSRSYMFDKKSGAEKKIWIAQNGSRDIEELTSTIKNAAELNFSRGGPAVSEIVEAFLTSLKKNGLL